MSSHAAHNLPLDEMDRRSFIHPFTDLNDHARHGSLIMASATGLRVRDVSGKDYLDAMAGLWCVNVGWGRDEIVEAAARAMRELAFYQTFASVGTPAVIELADRLRQMTPASVNHVFFGNSGSDANDTLIKIIWHYNNILGREKKKKIITRGRGYHGVTVFVSGLTVLPGVNQGHDLDPRILRARCPHWYWEHEEGEDHAAFADRLARELDELITSEGPDTVAAMIAEPVMGAGGLIVPPDAYFDKIVPVLKKHDILLIADEVICGFGRLGTAFGSDAYGLQPDCMTLAKGLTSAYVPMSASLVSDAIFEVLKEGSRRYGAFGHGYTYSGHPVAAAAALANLDIMAREKLFDRSARMGEILIRTLKDCFADHPLVAEVRGRGLLAGVELAADKTQRVPFDGGLGVAKRVYKKCLEVGLVTRALNATDTLAFSPALTISEDEIGEIADKLETALNSVMGEMIRAEDWHPPSG